MVPFAPVIAGRSGGHGTPHRPDIDGLRALAVCAVVLFHAAPTLSPGGFLGVDVFFVISGFLITGILIRECEAGEFSLIGFYERRIRRILPALAVVLVVGSALAFGVLTPSDLSEYGRSLAAMALLSSNQFFLSRSGYFDPDSRDNILLHTWSLSIEEQFYLLWPLVLLLLYRLRLQQHAPLLILVALLASLAMSEWLLIAGNGPASFYMLRSRAWELLLGALLATGRIPDLRSRAAREAVSGVGLLTVVGSIAAFGEASHFPGLMALAPCLGTAAMIHANRESDTLVARLLSTPIAVSVGLISYSLYLWHWPALVLPRLVLARPLAPGEVAGAVAVALILAWLSWRYVERPFRKGPGQGTGLKAVAVGTGILIAAWGVGSIAWISGGLPQRAPPAVLRAEAAARSINPFTQFCHVSGTELPPADRCTTASSGTLQTIVWGDSHAAHMMPLAAAWARPRDLAVRQITKSSCLPLVLRDPSPLAGKECQAFNHAVLDAIATTSSNREVVLAGRWARYMVPKKDGEVAAEDRLHAALLQTVDRIREQLGDGVLILLVGSTPDFAFDPSVCYARGRFIAFDTAHCEIAVAANASRAATADRVLSQVAQERPNVRTLLPWRRFCQSDRCRTTTSDGRFLFRDDHHLTIDGALLLIDELGAAESGRRGGSSPSFEEG